MGTISADLRCARCSAHVRAGSDWCTLCYADLRPPQEPAPSGSTSPATLAPHEVTPAGEDVPQPPPGGRRRRIVSGSEAPRPEDIEAVAEEMLARLAESESPIPLGRLGALAGVLDSKGKRAVFMMVGGGLGMLVIFLLMLALGSLV